MVRFIKLIWTVLLTFCSLMCFVAYCTIGDAMHNVSQIFIDAKLPAPAILGTQHVEFWARAYLLFVAISLFALILRPGFTSSWAWWRRVVWPDAPRPFHGIGREEIRRTNSRNIPFKHGCYELVEGDLITTNKYFKAPVAIRIIAQTNSTNLRIEIAGTFIIFNWEMNFRQIRYDHGPLAGRHHENNNEDGEIPIKQWVAVDFVLLEDRLYIFVDGERRANEPANFSGIEKPIKIFTCANATILVKSIRWGVPKRSVLETARQPAERRISKFKIENYAIEKTPMALGSSIFSTIEPTGAGDAAKTTPMTLSSSICPIIGSTGTGDPTTERVYIQLVLACLTEASIDKCRGHLIRILKRNLPTDPWLPTPVNERLGLKWSLTEDEEITLEPHAETRLNILYSERDAEEIVPEVKALPLRAAGVLSIPGMFRFDVKVSGHDTLPAFISLIVTFGSSRFDDLAVELEPLSPVD
jgi:hypothetical protein